MSGARFTQRVTNIAREKSYGMVKIAIDGRFLPLGDDKIGLGIEGPMSKERFDMVRDFMNKIMQIRNSPEPVPSSSPTLIVHGEGEEK